MKILRIMKLTMLFLIVFVCVFSIIQKQIRNILFFNDPNDVDNFLLIDTPGCKIPKLDPFDSSIYWYLWSGSELKCAVKEDLVKTQNRTIFINWSLVRSFLPRMRYCKYDVIWRPPDIATDHNYYQFINESEPFTTNVTVKDEFVRVRCFDSNHKVIYTNVFSFIQLKPEVEKKCNDRYRNHSSDKQHLSVMMVGIDSISRNNMIRYMPQTRDYLINKMSAIEFLGYNKVADNTFVNIIPMTTGQFVNDLFLNESVENITLDNYEYIWDTFSKCGYRTLYSEDAPKIQIFDYSKKGFAKPHADYFNRHFSVAMEDITTIWNTGHNCVHARPETSIILDQLKDFAIQFKSVPYFSFTFVSRLTHDVLSDTKLADLLYKNFLESIFDGDILNNTVVIVFSDHGIRFGKVRQTYVGKIEERLPFLFLLFPKWFKTSFPIFYSNVETNSRRLTTPFDIFETLNHILNIQNFTTLESRGKSVLFEISGNRSCSEAGILPHWCTCAQQKTLSLDDPIVIFVAQAFINKLNKQISNYPQCDNLELKHILSASMTVSNKDVLGSKDTKGSSYLKTYIDYQITLETTPGNAIFEGSIRYDEYWKNIVMIGDFSRINLYGNTSYCVEGSELKKICYCKDQTKI